MPVHVNEVSTEITARPEDGGEGPAPPAPGDGSRWKAVDRLRSARARLESEEARTRAEGFHG